MPLVDGSWAVDIQALVLSTAWVSTVSSYLLILSAILTSNIDVLQFEIVTPDGVLRTANKYQEKDLFWALRGSGPGFGVRDIVGKGAS